MAKENGFHAVKVEFNTKHGETDWSHVPFWTSQRFLTTVVSFVGFVCLYMQRVNLSIAMVCMVKQDGHGLYDDEITINNSKINSSEYGLFSSQHNRTIRRLHSQVPNMIERWNKSVPPDIHQPRGEGYCDTLDLVKMEDNTGEFTWDKELQGILLGSFFWGYLILQVPGGMLSEIYGPRRVVFWTMMPVGILGLLTPVSARLSPWLLIVIRVLVGVGQGTMYPAGTALFSGWAPNSERSRLLGIALSGGQFGNALVFPISGLLCSTLGWDSVFYVMGVFGVVWSILWWCLVFDSPALSPRISVLEKSYIQEHTSVSTQKKKKSTPWRGIFSSLPFWSILVSHTCINYGLYMMLTQMPTYMKEVLKFDLKSNGLYSMLPYLSMWVCIAVSSALADHLIGRNILSKIWTRKIMTSTGFFASAVCMVMLTYMDCTQQVLAVILLCGSVGLQGMSFAGCLINHGEIAPQFAGTLFGLTNVSATIPGILAPYIVGALTPNKTREEWQIAFFIASAVYIFGALFYLIFAKATPQKWAVVDEQSATDVVIPESKYMIDISTEIKENKV